MAWKYTHSIDAACDDEVLWEGRDYIPQHRRRRLIEKFCGWIEVLLIPQEYASEVAIQHRIGEDLEVLRMNSPSTSWEYWPTIISAIKYGWPIYSAKRFDPHFEAIHKIPRKCSLCDKINRSVERIWGSSLFLCDACHRKVRRASRRTGDQELDPLEYAAALCKVVYRQTMGTSMRGRR